MIVQKPGRATAVNISPVAIPRVAPISYANVTDAAGRRLSVIRSFGEPMDFEAFAPDRSRPFTFQFLGGPSPGRSNKLSCS
jgi:hypothetical protein